MWSSKCLCLYIIIRMVLWGWGKTSKLANYHITPHMWLVLLLLLPVVLSFNKDDHIYIKLFKCLQNIFKCVARCRVLPLNMRHVAIVHTFILTVHLLQSISCLLKSWTHFWISWRVQFVRWNIEGGFEHAICFRRNLRISGKFIITKQLEISILVIFKCGSINFGRASGLQHPCVY